MFQQFIPFRLRRGFALLLALTFSGLLQPLSLSTQAQTSAKSHSRAPVSKENRLAKTNAGLPNHYGALGPTIRVALATDVTTVALSSSSGLTIRGAESNKEYLLNHELTAEARLPSAAATPAPSQPVASSAPTVQVIPPAASVYRVEIATFSEARQAEAAIVPIRKKFDQTATTIHNNQTGEYRIITGKYTSKVQASDMVEIFREAGYAKAQLLVSDSSESSTDQVNNKASIKRKSTVAKSNHSPAKNRLMAKSRPTVKRHAAKSTSLAVGKNRATKSAFAAYSASNRKSKSKSSRTKPAMLAVTKKNNARPATTENAAARSSTAAQIMAFDADKTLTASDHFLSVAPRENTGKANYYEDGGVGLESAKNTARNSSGNNPVTLRFENTEYRGEIQLILNERGRLNVINVLPMEDYLRGVVPAEIAAAATPIEALKAQAVAARSYALANLGRFRDEGFDLRGDGRSQVYGGFSAENVLTNRAVEETRGLVALYFGETGRGLPIEALYTADCGGKTENSENIFSGKALSYLRAVECADDDRLPTGREILSSAKIEPIGEPFGHSFARDMALFSVLEFALPERLTNDYLRGAVERTELQAWAERASKLTRGATTPSQTTEIRRLNSDTSRVNADSLKRASYDSDSGAFDINHEMAVLRSQRRDITKLPAFATLMALATYGENRESLFMSPADANYILAGLGAEEVPKEARADLALLIKDGILRLPGDGQINVRNSLSRGYVIETFVRAVLFKPQPSQLNLQTAVAASAQKNAITVTQIKEPARAGSRNIAVRGAPENRQEYEVEKNARLFRVFNDESYAVDRLGIAGSERVNYHLNNAGRIDFLEVEAAGRDAAREKATDASSWRETISADELQRRLARSNIEVGDVESLTPLAFGESRRVIELEVIGSDKRVQLRGAQIKSALGLKDNPLVVEHEARTGQFIFTGKGQGHGIGLCQVGAMRLAKQGQSYIGILQHFYTGISVQRIY